MNSIKNSKNDDAIELQEDEDARKIVRCCLDDLLEKVEEVIKNKEGTKRVEPSNNEREDSGSLKPDSSDKSEDLDVTIIENEEVIMIISDSEEETVQTAEEKKEVKETKMDVEEAPAEDVQSLLDKMMEQTMKDTEKMDYSDPNNSGTEQVEEVVLKEDAIHNSKGY